MANFLDICIGGKRFDKDVDDIIPPSDEKPFWLIMRNGKVIACASKGVEVKYRRVEEHKRTGRLIEVGDGSGLRTS